jgi:hypothetical protein
MRLRSSREYDANDVASDHIRQEEHAAFNQRNGIETQLMISVDGI